MNTKKDASLINDPEESGSTSSSEVLTANFFAKLGQNSGKIVEISTYNIADRHPRSSRFSEVYDLKGYTYNEIQVTAIDLSSKPGYARINNEVDIPLVNLKRPSYPCYSYDKEEALRRVNELNVVAFEAIKELAEAAVAAADFMEEVTKKGLN